MRLKVNYPCRKWTFFAENGTKKAFQAHHTLLKGFFLYLIFFFNAIYQILILFPLRSFRLMTDSNTIRRTYHISFYFIADNFLHYLECNIFDISAFFHFTLTSCFIIFAKHIKNAHNMIATDI